MFVAKRYLSWIAAFALLGPPRWLAADEAPPRLADEQRAALSRTIREILIEALPRQIEDADDWGAQKEIVAGLKFDVSDGRPQWTKRTQSVNHGLWRQIIVEPIAPERQLHFEIVEARAMGPQRVAFELLASAPLHGTARVERWRWGVKMLNVATEADATIEIRLAGEVHYRTEWHDAGHRLILRPTIHQADLKLVEFDLQRLGILEGSLAEELGDRTTRLLGKQLDKQEPKVVEKINQTLLAQSDKLVLNVDWSWLTHGLSEYRKRFAPPTNP